MWQALNITVTEKLLSVNPDQIIILLHKEIQRLRHKLV